MDLLTSNVIYVDKRADGDRYATSDGYLNPDAPTTAAESAVFFGAEAQEVQLNISTLLSVFSKGRVRSVSFVDEVSDTRILIRDSLHLYYRCSLYSKDSGAKRSYHDRPQAYIDHN